MRIAIFFTPPPEHPLTRAAALWLGREPFTGEEFAQNAVDGFTRREIRELTASPRRYGFHATLQAPVHLAEGISLRDVEEALDATCASLQPVSCAQVGGCGHSSRRRRRWANQRLPACRPPVRAFRAPPSARIERQPQRLHAQRQYLERWKYPYVFDFPSI
jgi:hypothetical protein